MRRKSREINIGNVKIGGENKIAVQTMTTADTADIFAVSEQANRLHEAGADIVRLAVTDTAAAKGICEIKKRTKCPLVADIHFDFRLALLCIDGGIDKIRINPGNIGSRERVSRVAKAAIAANVPIRIGVNSGSLEEEIKKKYGNTARAMVESAKYHISLLENEGMENIAVSLKSSDVKKTVEAYRLMAKECDYPLHLGVTEAGTAYKGIVKSCAGIGALLLDGIGDTIRVSLTADPVEEVRAARALLSAVGLMEGPQLVSCPTCGRCRVDIFSLANKVDEYLEKVSKPIKVAVMGCAVNGPGEAADADVGIAGGNGCGVIFRNGKIVKTVREEELLRELFMEIDAWRQKL